MRYKEPNTVHKTEVKIEDEANFFPDCILRKLICDMKKGDTTGFSLRSKHFTVVRDEL